MMRKDGGCFSDFNLNAGVGLRKLKRNGGRVLAQDEASSVVFGFLARRWRSAWPTR